MNRDESFGIYLIIDGKPDNIIYHSRISGISELILRNTPKERRDDHLYRMLLIGWGGILVIVILLICTFVQSKRMNKKFEKMLQAIREEESSGE